MQSRLTRTVRLLCIVALTLSATVGVAQADGDPTTDNVPRMLPYQGMLELDGQPVNAVGANAINVMFALYDGPGAEQPTYRQQLSIEVYSGRFTATIGPIGIGPDDQPKPIAQVISAADDLYLGMTLLGDLNDPADDIALSNRQRILATPFAMWTTSATDLNVARALVVGGNATVQGDLTVGGAVNLPAGAINTADLADAAVTPGKVAIGGGLRARGGDTLGVDDTYLDARIRAWVRDHCTVELGQRDRCFGNCTTPAEQHSVIVKADRTCVPAANNSCRNSGWGAFRVQGTMNTEDDLFIRFNCN